MKPGKVPGPVRVKPNKKSDLTDYRRAKRVQDYLNALTAKFAKPMNWESIGFKKPERE